MKLSSRILSMQESPIRKLVPYSLQAAKEGKKIYHLNIGQPDIETPESFMNSIREFDAKTIAYAHSAGDFNLIDAVIKYFERLDIHFEREDIIVTNGGSEALQFAIVATCDYDDELLVPEPFYTNYNGFSMPFGTKIKPITTSPDDGFRLPSLEDMEKLITEKTRGIMLSNPGNPTGTVYTKEEIERVSELALKHDLYIIADEVYREFTYGTKAVSFATVDKAKDNVIIVDSISKRFSACGARIGFIASKNKELMRNVMKLAQSRLCVPTLEMIGARSLYELDESYFEPIKQEYQKRRDILVESLQAMDGVFLEVPQGAFYAIAKLPVDNAEDFAIWLLKEFSYEDETVMVAPAEGFYATEGLGTTEVRIAYVLKSEDLKRAMDLLARALKEYPGRTN